MHIGTIQKTTTKAPAIAGQKDSKSPAMVGGGLLQVELSIDQLYLVTKALRGQKR